MICVSGTGSKEFSSIISNSVTCLDCIEKGQNFPRYLFNADNEKIDAISDDALKHFQIAYGILEQVLQKMIFSITYMEFFILLSIEKSMLII